MDRMPWSSPAFAASAVLVATGLAQASVVTWQQDTAAPPYVTEALTAFRAPPDSADVATLLARWRSDGGLDDASDRIRAAELWRRAGVADDALALLTVSTDLPLSSARLRLERARVRFELGPSAASRRRAHADWQAACEAIGTLPAADAATLRAEFWRDFGLLATPQEREAWTKLSADETCPWLNTLLEDRAFRMALTPGERLGLHYARLAEARRSFYLDRPRFYAGMSHWHGRPDDAWLDDRGLVYVRMGRPDDMVACGSGPGLTDEDFVRELRDNDLLATCWVYDRPGGYRLYYFSSYNKVTDRVMPQVDYWLQESLGPRARPGDPYFHEYVRHAALPRSVKRHLALKGRFRASADAFDAGLDRAESQAYVQMIRVATRRYADEALVEVPDVPRARGMEMLWESLRFLNPADGSWQVWMLASLPAGQLEPIAAAGGVAYAAHARLAARVGDTVVLDSAWNRSVTERPLPPDAGLPLRTFVVAPEGPLPVTLVARDAARPEAGAWIQDTIVVPRVVPFPTLSDIAVASREGGSWTRDGETFLQVSPDHVTAPDGTLFVYFEVYGMRGRAPYDVEVRLTKDRSPQEALALAPDDVPFRLGFRDVMPPRRTGRHTLRLDLSGTEPGRYDLTVQVTDGDTGTRSLPAVTPIVVADPRDSE